MGQATAPRPALVTTPGAVRAPAAFWGRLRQHVADSAGAQAHPAARSLWEKWLTPAGVEALLAGAANPATAFPAGRSARDTSRASDPAPAVVERLRGTVAKSLERPLALRFETGATSQSRPSLYYVVLSNGASLTLRGDSSGLELEDCFFSRAAVEACDEVATEVASESKPAPNAAPDSWRVPLPCSA